MNSCRATQRNTGESTKKASHHRRIVIELPSSTMGQLRTQEGRGSSYENGSPHSGEEPDHG
jgi:hypothetical protein